jgi:hypothetical protein
MLALINPAALPALRIAATFFLTVNIVVYSFRRRIAAANLPLAGLVASVPHSSRLRGCSLRSTLQPSRFSSPILLPDP